MKLGSAKYGSDYTKKKYFKLKDGEASFRILPPMGALADDGRWSVFYSVHYGYRNSKGELRVFQSPLVKNRQTKMIEVPDAALERIEKLKAELEKAKAAGNKELVDKLNVLVGPKAQYNLDSNHYMNVIDTQGNIGVLKIRHRAKLALDAAIKKLREQGIDPLSIDDGRYFTFSRSGNARDTIYQVSVMKENITVQGMGVVQRDVVHKLNEETILRLSKEAAELDKIFKKLTSDEVARIVNSTDLLTGKSPVVDELFTAQSAQNDAPDAEDEEEPASGTSTGPTAQPAAQSAPAQTLTQQTATTAQPLTQQTAAPANAGLKTTAQKLEEQSEQDFLKSLGIG
jgi:hypothetical protein